MGSSLYTRKQAVVNATKARLFAKLQEIQGAAIYNKLDTQGVVLVHFVPPGHTVNAVYYCTLILSDRLRPAVRRKRPGLLNKGVILQHDNAPPHRARQRVEKIEEMG